MGEVGFVGEIDDLAQAIAGQIERFTDADGSFRFDAAADVASWAGAMASGDASRENGQRQLIEIAAKLTRADA